MISNHYLKNYLSFIFHMLISIIKDKTPIDFLVY